MKWTIVTDSGCDIRTMESPNFLYQQVPLSLQLGDDVYVDDAKLDTAMFVEALNQYKGKTVSACPSPGAWKKAFSKADHVIALPISGGMSSSFESAQLGMKLALEENPNRKILVVDSSNASSGIIVLLQKLAEFIEEGIPFEQIEEKYEQYKKKVRLIFTLKKLDNLAKNGRVNKAVAAIAGVLNIQVIATASPEGKFDTIGKARGESKALASIVNEMVKAGCGKTKAIITHCHNLPAANALREMIEKTFDGIKVQVFASSGLVSYYAEKGGLLVGFEC